MSVHPYVLPAPVDWTALHNAAVAANSALTLEKDPARADDPNDPPPRCVVRAHEVDDGGGRGGRNCIVTITASPDLTAPQAAALDRAARAFGHV